MVRIRRIAAIAILAVVAATYGTVSPAHADTPEVFDGSSLATGLDLDVLGNKLTLGHATASVVSATEAVGLGAGQLLALTSPTLRSIATPARPGPASAVDRCAGVDLPAPLGTLLTLGVACGASTASFTNGLPIATGTGKVLGLSVNTGQLLEPINTAVGVPLLNTVRPILDALDAAGQPLNLAAGDLVKKLIEGGLSAQTLARVTLGESASKVVSEVGRISSTSTASGAEVKLLPPPAVGQISEALRAVWNQPFVTITVASAKATATYDRSTGVASPTVDPSLVRIKIADFLNVAGLREVNLAPGQNLTILENTPLESTISIADGTTALSADRSAAGARADGVALHLLKGINGGVKLNLAHAEANVAGKPATVLPKVKAVEQVGELARTGGPGPMFPALGAAVLVLAIVGRRAYVLRSR